MLFQLLQNLSASWKSMVSAVGPGFDIRIWCQKRVAFVVGSFVEVPWSPCIKNLIYFYFSGFGCYRFIFLSSSRLRSLDTRTSFTFLQCLSVLHPGDWAVMNAHRYKSNRLHQVPCLPWFPLNPTRKGRKLSNISLKNKRVARKRLDH